MTSVRPLPHDWAKEYAALSQSDDILPPEDLERYAVAAHLLGEDEQAFRLLDSAHRSYLEQGRSDKAARCVFWLIYHLRYAGQSARAAGWIVRLRRIVEDQDPERRLLYLVLLGEGVSLMQAGAAQEALPMVEQAAAGARAVGDDDLYVLAGMARGRCLDLQDQRAQALAAFDEIMVYVVADRVAPQVIGLAYCSVISLCMERFDIERAGEWTRALAGWCDAQSGLMPYRGECQVHRAEIFQLHGSWAEAIDEAVLVSQRVPVAGFVAGAAHYRLAELHRLRGHWIWRSASTPLPRAAGARCNPALPS